MLDRDGPIPIYKQIAEAIRERIVSGDITPGEAMPSETELEGEYDIARTTARRVARELREQGLVYTVQGEGTFVGEPEVPRAPRKTPVYQQIANEIAGRIREGEFLPNRAIPSEKALMEQYGVAKVTVRNSVAFLREQGWVFTVRHRGTYVSQPEAWPDPAK
ncbi:GntR family transcriptional regulator [Streptosporangium sp. NBC_01639]|uniref:GntR family transcriptional regulator n=1 Tax=Streptosporangium sp. NBC_01639 TaxID=2975948 RepID=UPI0038637B07|nr:GntR family transcriptional regulator [Streptosporangium sp. NBC_01639]